jgi:hypothetical protein
MENTAKKYTNKDTKKPLLILDINGLFVYRIYKNTSSSLNKDICSCLNKDICEIQSDSVKKVGNYIVYKREGINNFLEKIFKIFDVAVWSSARMYNIKNILNYIFEGREKELLFVWSQKECKIKYKQNSKPTFLKNLSLVNENFPQYNINNIYIVDDSKEKMYNNPKNNCIIVQQWIPININTNINSELVKSESNETLDDIFLLILGKIKD